MFQSIGHRAWHAYYCLHRDEKGEPPKYRELERDHDLHNGALQKLVTGKLKRPGLEVLDKCANALAVNVRWLQFGEGDAPRSAWLIPPYPYAAASSGLSSKAKAAFESDTKKLTQGTLARRPKSARK